MRTVQRLALAFAVLSMFCGVAALAVDPVPLAGGNCNTHENTRGKGPDPRCEVFCTPCERVVCDGKGYCKARCVPIEGCVPS